MMFIKLVLFYSLFFFLRNGYLLITSAAERVSVISSHFPVVPEYCHDSYVTIKCFELCTEDTNLVKYPKNDLDSYLVIEADVRNKGGSEEDIERIYSNCSTKCESDPVFWTCIEECEMQNYTYDWDQDCFRSRPTPKCNYKTFSGKICLDCLLKSLRGRLSKACEISYPPNHLYGGVNLCEKLTKCDSNSSSPSTQLSDNQYIGQLRNFVKRCTQNATIWENVTICVNDQITENQRACCYSEEIREAVGCTNDRDCDEVCMSLLSPRMCYEKCKKFRRKEILECKKEVDLRYPISEDLCVHCTQDNSTERTGYLQEKKCVQQCTTFNCSLNCINNVMNLFNAKHMKKNCLLNKYVWGLNFLNVAQIVKDSRINFKEDSVWISTYKTPLECSSVETCASELEEVVNLTERQAVCESNPFRALDFIACALYLNVNSISLDNIKFVQNLSLYLSPEIDCLNRSADIRLKLYQLTYTFESQIACEQCRRRDYRYHPLALENFNVRETICQGVGNSPYCKPKEDGHLVQLTNFATCRWTVDFSKSEDPFVLWATYFSELGPTQVRTKLEHPDTTKILHKTKYNGKPDFYAFPYFLIFRSVCDEGYYDDNTYKFFMKGGSPHIIITYMKPTNRHSPSEPIRGVFDGALIKLKRRPNDNLIPENPRSAVGDTEERTCLEQICYPAFAVPLLLLQISNFEVTINSQETYSELRQRIYVSSYHARTVDGLGEIQIAAGKYPAQAGMLFPKTRSNFATDSELSYHANCIRPRNRTGSGPEAGKGKEEICTELDHVEDDFFQPYQTNIFSPLDAEDVLRTQYTFGTSPVQVIAGFYDPRLLIIGDADMEKINVVNWGNLLKDLEKIPDMVTCTHPYFKHRGFLKPIYSYMDKSDPMFPIKHYRQRYAPLRFESDLPADKIATTGIFEAIGLEDRLLLVTQKGLVPFYGHSNATVAQDKAWKYDEDEILNKCFKIVRILPRAQPNVDLIVGITYEYAFHNHTTNSSQEVNQELWVGTFATAGEKIKWLQIQSNPLDSIFLEEWVMNGEDPRGGLLPISSWKDPHAQAGRREANPRSQIESICFKAHRSKIKMYSSYVKLIDEPGWCEALDATPVPLKENTIQVLVRMRIFYTKDGSRIYLYLVATHSFHSTGLEATWNIETIIPRYPCVNDHQESIRNVVELDKRYFDDEVQAEGGHDFIGCHEGNKFLWDNQIFLHGMTYTKSYTSHLFLFGSRLLQSANQGKNFIFLRSFPQRLSNIHDKMDTKLGRHVHRIIHMAFDGTGHYAFITNKRELWLGSTGSIHQIRLRPSPLQSMVQLAISKVRNINDGVPFTVDFDSKNQLYEMVAILDEAGHVSRVMKRPVGEWHMMGVRSLLDSLNTRSNKMIAIRADPSGNYSVLKKPFHYNIADWAPYCPFASPNIRQNFSKTKSRTLDLIFPHPTQHMSLGRAHIEESLQAFQVATFSLIWKSFFVPPKRSYVGYNKDPFTLWNILKRKEEPVESLQYILGDDPKEYGILVSPSKHKRQSIVSSRQFIKYYYLDYSVVAELRLEFSLKNDYMVKNKDFYIDEINQIQLNVENANGRVIQINTEKEILANKAAVLFIVTMSVSRRAGIKQNPSGQNMIPVPVTYHLIGAFGNCIKSEANGILGDTIESYAVVGCPPSLHFVFDWNSTLNSIHLRGDKTPGAKVPHGIGSLCYKGEFACFFARSPLVLHFSVFDEAKQVLNPYTGKFIMRIVGGGRTKKEIERYSQEEIEAFNIPGVSDVSLIWNEWDPINHKKIERKLEILYDRDGNQIDRDVREAVLESGKTSITWACHTLSPCASISPTSSFEVVFWFRILISNRDVDTDTLCLFEKEFDIMLYGFPPAPGVQLCATLGSALLIMGMLYLLFMCCRSRARLWRHTKFTVQNWYFIVKDAIPKKLRLYELPLNDEEKVLKEFKKHQRKQGSDDNFSENEFSASSLDIQDSLDAQLPKRETSSASTIESLSTTAGSAQVIPKDMVGHIPGSKKSVVYDQILSRRLNSIVVRNRNMRQNLLKKASVNAGGVDLEIEEHFERQFGRTASEESLFTPPLPKDRKGGIDSFI